MTYVAKVNGVEIKYSNVIRAQSIITMSKSKRINNMTPDL